MSEPEWVFYYPDDGESQDDARPIIGRIPSPRRAAIEACEYDYNNRDGWERIDREFLIAVISPDGIESRFMGRHEPSISHCVEEAPLTPGAAHV